MTYRADGGGLDWSRFLQEAGQATQGVNRMPHVFSGYGNLPSMSQQDIMALFYPTSRPAEQPTDTGKGKPDPSGGVKNLQALVGLPEWIGQTHSWITEDEMQRMMRMQPLFGGAYLGVDGGNGGQ
jgi:hypothetical protein